MRITTWTLIALLSAAGTALASEDLTVVSSTTRNGKPTGKTINYLSADHVRMEHAGSSATIIDAKTGTMTIIDHDKKTYYSITRQDLADMNARMQERTNTPEAKKGMQAMQGMASETAASYEVKKTGQTRKVGPYTCEEWTITMGPTSTMKECVTSEVQYPAKAFEAFKAFGESMRAPGPFAPAAKAGDTLAEKMKVIKGFPVATSMTSEILGKKTTSETEVLEISHAPIPGSTWAVPAGYARTENPMRRAFGRRAPSRR